MLKAPLNTNQPTCFYVILDHPVLLVFFVLGLVSSLLSQEIGWEERIQNELICVEWDVKP